MELKIIDTTENCRHCLMCRHMCPVGHVTHLESHTPHGWGQVVASEKRGLIEWNDATVGLMFNCADCGLCESHCVTDQPLPHAIAAVRAMLIERGLAPAAVTDLKARFGKWENLYAEKSPEGSEGTSEDVLFVGDAPVYLAPESLAAAMSLLEAAGVNPIAVGSGRNSGFLANSLGFTALAKSLAEKNIEEIKARGAKRVFVLSPGDYYTFTSVYAERMGVTWPESIEVVDLVAFLAEKMGAGEISFNRIDMGLPQAYVDPTHTVRTPARFEAPRQLLEAVLPTPPLELFWRKDRAFPGGDGLLAFVNPSISKKLTLARIEDAKDAGAQGMITEDPATLYHLNQASSTGLPAKGLYELLAERLV